MKDRDRPPSSQSSARRSADARGDTGTDADALRSRPDVGAPGDVGGIPSTVDAGVRDKLGDRADATMNRPVGREHVSQPPEPAESTRAADRPTPPKAGDARAAAADEESPVESLGKAISEPVTGSTRSTPDAPRRH
jgi:hypothetical protein